MDVLADTLTVPMLAELLREPEQALLARVLQALGQERCTHALVETLSIESNGGMLTRAGNRRRTPGGVFFHLVRQQCTKEEKKRLFPYRVLKQAQRQARVSTRAIPSRPAPAQAPLTLTLTLWKGLRPMPVTATLKLVLRDLPETRQNGEMLYMALHNAPRGLPKGISLDAGPLYLTAPVKQWKTACTRAEQIRATGTPALLIVEAHVSTKEGAIIGVVKGVQVVEGKATAMAPSA